MKTSNSEAAIRISVVGIGGGGTNAVERIWDENIPMVQCVAINTDNGAVENAKANLSLQIGLKTTNGMGAGADFEKGRLSAQEDRPKIEKAIKNCDMLFIVCGMGGGTGTGAAPVVAEIAKELNILTVGVVTKPFGFEGKRRTEQAECGIKRLSKSVDALIIIPNDNLKLVSDKRLTFSSALAMADEVLAQTVKNIVETVQRTALVNCDFADICCVLRCSGTLHTAAGAASGQNRAQRVKEQILSSKLLGTSAEGADSALLCITAPKNVGLDEIETISKAVADSAKDDANIIFGLDFDTGTDEIKAVLLAATKEPVPSFSIDTL